MDALMLSQPETVAFGIAAGEKGRSLLAAPARTELLGRSLHRLCRGRGSNMAAFNLLARPGDLWPGQMSGRDRPFPVGLMLVMLAKAWSCSPAIRAHVHGPCGEKRITLTAMLRNLAVRLPRHFLGSVFVAP